MVTASGLKLVPKSTEPPKRSLWDHYIKNIITGTFYDIACHVSQGDRNVSLNFKKTFLLLFNLQHENNKWEGCHRLEWVVSATFSKVCNRTSCWEAWAFKLALYWVGSPLTANYLLSFTSLLVCFFSLNFDFSLALGRGSCYTCRHSRKGRGTSPWRFPRSRC